MSHHIFNHCATWLREGWDRCVKQWLPSIRHKIFQPCQHPRGWSSDHSMQGFIYLFIQSQKLYPWCRQRFQVSHQVKMDNIRWAVLWYWNESWVKFRPQKIKYFMNDNVCKCSATFKKWPYYWMFCIIFIASYLEFQARGRHQNIIPPGFWPSDTNLDSPTLQVGKMKKGAF